MSADKAKPALVELIQRCEVKHPNFANVLATLRTRVNAAISGRTPKVTRVVGPSHSGKTRLLAALQRAYQPTTLEGRRVLPFVTTTALTAATTLLLPMTVLDALGVPYNLNNASTARLSIKMRNQLALMGCKAIAFDAASQMVEPASEVLPFEAAAWFNETAASGYSEILMGMPRLERLFKASPELRARSHSKIELRPYDISVEADRHNYLTAVNTFLEVFKKAGWTFAESPQVIGANCYLFAPGLIGGVSAFMEQLATDVGEGPPREITFADLAAAADKLETLGDPRHAAFAKREPSLSQVCDAFDCMKQANEMDE